SLPEHVGICFRHGQGLFAKDHEITTAEPGDHLNLNCRRKSHAYEVWLDACDFFPGREHGASNLSCKRVHIGGRINKAYNAQPQSLNCLYVMTTCPTAHPEDSYTA